MGARYTLEFDDEEERELKEAIVDAAAASLTVIASSTFEKVIREQIDVLEPEIRRRAGTIVDEALTDSAIGLPTMIMERVRHEIEEKLPSRLEGLVRGALIRIATEESRKQQLESEKQQLVEEIREASRPPRRVRRWGRKHR